MRLTDMARAAGLTAGAEVMAKTMKSSEIRFISDLDIFEIDDGLVASVAQSMMETGYDKSQPLVVWKGRGCVVDGRTRLRAALVAGLPEVPVVEKEFENLEGAIRYAFRRQAERRNLTQGEILEAAARLGIKERRDGTGRSGERLAKDLGVSESTIRRARTVAKRGSGEDLAAIKKGQKSINEVYQRLREKKAKEPAEGDGPKEVREFPPDDSVCRGAPEGPIDPLGGGDVNFLSGLGETELDGPETNGPGDGEEPRGEDRGGEGTDAGESINVNFLIDEENAGDGVKLLRSAVILLGENEQLEGARLLIRRFIRREKASRFMLVLPRRTRELLETEGGIADWREGGDGSRQ
jgi:hypothetical protein